ncbi:DNA polymerase III subunit delta [Lysinibacillus sp. 2017]|uniref:DNA polymerase III subunit delta n=1 Tax=unclassified Lysinibacillus TaxID=2636778 RepID=UPI000D52A762|nr:MULTISPECIES: DNA polymerase III subunit delta [unclassified Lysinibacillus]AWE08690.1 DNA polymerase III subunit delta [Lysinibacillus sp. 2017]TGN35111.1 DNA polymerase III subunit delta [Lysinibacillus sp. S2017]
MEEETNGCCENCGRSTEVVEIETVVLNNHIAQLCLACTHVLTLPKNESRFLQLVRKKGRKESNKEMQKAHKVLSLFLALGTLFLVMIAAAGVSQGLDFATWLEVNSHYEIATEYVSFVEINNYD